MRMADSRFNPYLVLTLAVSFLLATGCLTPEEKRQRKMQAALRMHLSAPPNQTELREPVIIAGTTIYVEKAFFLDERSLESAAIVESPGGGFSMRLEFNDHGRMTLESITAANPGRQIAIFTQFGAEQLDKGSWLAAPRIPRRLSDGVIVFSPGVSRETAEEIVLGLNNVATAQKKLLSDW
jgi:preprotein translocase subunit SecD